MLGPVADQMYSEFNKGSRGAARVPRGATAGQSQMSGRMHTINTDGWEESDGETNLRIEDFVDLGDSSSESDNETAVGDEEEDGHSTTPPTTSQESVSKRGASCSPEYAAGDAQPEWPTLHRPVARGAAGVKRDRHGAWTVSGSSPAMSAKLASKLASKSLSPSKRVKAKH